MSTVRMVRKRGCLLILPTPCTLQRPLARDRCGMVCTISSEHTELPARSTTAVSKSLGERASADGGRRRDLAGSSRASCGRPRWSGRRPEVEDRQGVAGEVLAKADRGLDGGQLDRLSQPCGDWWPARCSSPAIRQTPPGSLAAQSVRCASRRCLDEGAASGGASATSALAAQSLLSDLSHHAREILYAFAQVSGHVVVQIRATKLHR